MLVGDGINEIFTETGLTGLVKSDLRSKTAAGHSGIPKPDELFHIDRSSSLRPERGVHVVEGFPHLWAMAHDGADALGLSLG